MGRHVTPSMLSTICSGTVTLAVSPLMAAAFNSRRYVLPRRDLARRLGREVPLDELAHVGTASRPVQKFGCWLAKNRLDGERACRFEPRVNPTCPWFARKPRTLRRCRRQSWKPPNASARKALRNGDKRSSCPLESVPLEACRRLRTSNEHAPPRKQILASPSHADFGTK